ncbi:MAG: glycosyltransferase family 2 protein [Chitinophagaceae bacterium]
MANAGSSPLVSIITIVYNGERHVEQAILSVLNQSYKNIEYIIIDGGSKDSTVLLIKRYEDRLSYWCSEKDEGISHAFNKGLKKATGSIIGFINADDWYEPDTVELAVKHITGQDILYGDLCYWQNDRKLYIQKGNHNHLNLEMSINHPTVFIRKRCYDTFGFFDETLACAMDYELLLRLKLRGCTFRHIPQVMANMRLEGLSDKLWYTACKETLSVKNRYFKHRSITNTLYFFKQASAIILGRMLRKSGLAKFVKFYRTRFSLLKKQYD